MEHFSVAGPEMLNHVCNTDQFLVSGGSPTPTVCGNLHGEHSNYSNLTQTHISTLFWINFQFCFERIYIVYVDAGVGESNPILIK